MFAPFSMLINLLMEKSIAKKRSNIYMLIMLFSTAFIVAHLGACTWIALGVQEEGWITKLQTLPTDAGGDE